MKRMKLLFTLAIPVLLSQNAAAQTSSRLIAEAHWSNNGAIFTQVDTSYYTYSDGRGGDLKHKLNYDFDTVLTFSGGAFGYEYNYQQGFNSNNFITDSVTQYWDGTAWINGSKRLYFYNSSNVLTSIVDQTWGGSNWANLSSDAYTYNAAGQLFADQYQTWNGVSFTGVSQKTYYYDASGNKVQETDQTISGTSYQYTNQYTYTYSSTNQLLTSTSSTWSGSTWVPNTEYINTYDSSGDKITQLYQTYNASTSAWVPQVLKSYSGFTNQLPALETDQLWDTAGSGSYVNSIEYAYTYNSFNQLTSSIGTSWNVGGFYENANGDPAANYYYETYSNTTTSVKNVINNGGDVTIYPVPAQNMIHINLTWNQAQTATIGIYNMAGQAINQWTAPMGTQYNASIPVNSLADGIYLIKVDGAQGQIVKQIVVAH